MKKILFVYPRFSRHAEHHPELLDAVPMNEYLGSPSLGIAQIAAATPDTYEVEYRDDRLEPADRPTDADLVALSFFTPAATRALEIARYFRAEGKTVVAGGIFPSLAPDAVGPHVDALVLGEGELLWPRLLADWEEGRLARRYGPLSHDVSALPLPRMSLYLDAEREGFSPDDYPVQMARGCPLSCDACALPHSMTRSLRVFEIEHVLAQLDQLARAGKRACLTEDTSWFPTGRVRNRFEALLDALLERPERGIISYVGISAPMILSTPKRLLDKAKSAGVDMFYLVGGFDPLTKNAFTEHGADARRRAADAIARSFDAGIEPYTSFLIGNDEDDDGTVDRMLAFADETGIRKAEFAIFTPYPGTPAWHRLVAEDRILTRDWSRYNDANVVFRPARMSPEQLQESYLRLWREFYAPRMNLAALPIAARTIQF